MLHMTQNGENSTFTMRYRKGIFSICFKLLYFFFFHIQDMKQILYQAMEQAPSAEVVEPEVIARYYAKFDEQFFTYCDKELAMINTFYSGLRLSKCCCEFVD